MANTGVSKTSWSYNSAGVGVGGLVAGHAVLYCGGGERSHCKGASSLASASQLKPKHLGDKLQSPGLRKL